MSSRAGDNHMANGSLDVDGADFDCDAYLSHLLQRKSLDQLVQIEHEMVQNVSDEIHSCHIH